MRSTPFLVVLLACTGGITGTKDTPTDESDTDIDTDIDADTDVDTDTDTDIVDIDCTDLGYAAGPWEDHPIAQSGAPITRDPYEFDGGVGDLAAATVGTIDATVDVKVTSAIITSMGYVPDFEGALAEFWFEDANAAMTAFLVDTTPVDARTLRSGDEVSFTATMVTDYFGTLEVLAITDFALVSSGNPVHIIDAMAGGAPLDYATQGMRTVEVWGGLVGGPTDCPVGTNCFDYDYGAGTAIYRTESVYDELGDCVHYIGPLGVFDGAEQLNVSNFDWAHFF